MTLFCAACIASLPDNVLQIGNQLFRSHDLILNSECIRTQGLPILNLLVGVILDLLAHPARLT